ncbi:TlpA family protein disulfide reductase [Corynebacterium lujinxingii]|uniref:TlpA family protein disulfide reductase n=1 Tax=Corynebacterium lujinxingii TaxID=2763010 RepID=A0A7H0JZI3_9CORY|nr:TlpA disulfide reductase family protein [Corynebacterium lujinxingii]MBC3179623.1 TlpA family protein disulfide reductase [Corynebacterium lujinxingii]NNO10315.1 redoxin domain-containing protein [Corynebacterium lujinxingii]QNP90449.1 TlpA family protein disulfide reductase [Corynebacterium lujinxingii]
MTEKRKLVAAVCCAAALAVSACSNASTDQGGTFSFHSPGGQTEITYDEADRQPLAGFEGESLMEPDKTIALSDFAGQIVVLNAWGQWCAPCRAEVDDLQAVHERLQAQGDGTVLGINVRDSNAEIARDFVKDNGVTYPSIYDPPFKTAASLGGVPSSVIPTTIVLDKQHRPAAVFLREITADDLIEVVDRLAGEA